MTHSNYNYHYTPNGWYYSYWAWYPYYNKGG